MHNSPKSAKYLSSQRGVILFITLIVLVAMTLAAIAMMRSVDTGNTIANNITFGQNNTLMGDWAIEQAFVWLDANKTNLDANRQDLGYYATREGGHAVLVDADWFDEDNWQNARVYDEDSEPAAPEGYRVAVLINRMCSLTGSVSGTNQECMRTAAAPPTNAINLKVKTTDDDDDKTVHKFNASGMLVAGGSAAGGAAYNIPGNIFYRVTVRIEGPRNSLSIIQSMAAISPT